MTPTIHVTIVILASISVVLCIGVESDILLDTSPWATVVLAIVVPLLCAKLFYMKLNAKHGDRKDTLLGMGFALVVVSGYMLSSGFIESANESLGIHAGTFVWWYATVQIVIAIGVLAFVVGSILSQWMKGPSSKR